MHIEQITNDLKHLKTLIQNQNIDLNRIKNLVSEIKKNTNTLSLILPHLLDIVSSPSLNPQIKKFLLEEIAQIYETLFEIKKALNLYKILAKEFSDKKISYKIKLLESLKNFERLKYLFIEYKIPFEKFIDFVKKSQEKNESIETFLIKELKIPKQIILKNIQKYYHNIPALDLSSLKDIKKIPKVLEIKKQFFEEALCIPIIYQNVPYLITYYPENYEKIEEVKKILQLSTLDLKIAFAIKEDILELINKYYTSIETDSIQLSEEIDIIEELEEIEEEALVDNTIVQLVNSVIEDALKMRASDIHWENLSGKKGLQIRFRIDGECIIYNIIPYSQSKPVISRIKIMANLNIAEKRLPQDGKINFYTKDGKKFELRVATIPTVGNKEDVVIRILGGLKLRSLEEIDLLPENLEKLKKILELPYGLILAVGPTGSGKTTTLHAALKYLNKPNKKIWTAEDPVEIVQEGLRQVQVNPKIGLTFSRILRAFLRADPDIIMIGEIRDHETAHTLVEASLTGHLVLSTLHTNSASETVTRLLGIGIDPYNFADALLGILAQRLAKRLCNECKKPYTPSKKEIEKLLNAYGHHPIKPLTKEIIEKATFFQPVGCPSCNYIGYKGRIAIHELLIPDDEIKDLIIKNAPANEIRNTAIKKGFLTLKQDGILKVLKGETTLSEILKVTLR